MCVFQVQHHDGITGTESPKVADMYLQHLSQAAAGVDELLAALALLPHSPEKTASVPGTRRRGEGVHILPEDCGMLMTSM